MKTIILIIHKGKGIEKKRSFNSSMFSKFVVFFLVVEIFIENPHCLFNHKVASHPAIQPASQLASQARNEERKKNELKTRLRKSDYTKKKSAWLEDWLVGWLFFFRFDYSSMIINKRGQPEIDHKLANKTWSSAVWKKWTTKHSVCLCVRLYIRRLNLFLTSR